ncbi:putative endonuclease [Dulcicalothrix desertica PCC 7102]|uniref:Putative endonuclease n=1 Tax=Dulcicalothrix desertica PCC 7102 TaxID=232991 RepID=A0A3S1C0G8_9CYAN|nr:thermonuclease family protein [Dulcicalothrix desertica]RUS93127.1 putative endonuclease [Dulcicalothrix desertica PCC 7102]TWH62780.1 micrococcal nuclease [Dulcicalothrix desertica PCC 7102]
MKKLFPIALSLVVASNGAVSAQNVPAQVVSVGDGDTIRIALDGKTETIRMACMDAPEKRQGIYGAASTNRLKQLLPRGAAVQVRQIERDRYKRLVGEVFVGGKSINLQMVREGQAVVYRQYLNACASTQEQYIKAEAEAKRKRLGFWNQDNPVMPWDFRRNARKN